MSPARGNFGLNVAVWPELAWGTGDVSMNSGPTRHAIRLLSREGGLTAIALEGLAAADESGEPKGSWDGVDCTLDDGGVDARADNVTIEQLKDQQRTRKHPGQSRC